MTAYEMRISDWSSDVCSSDLLGPGMAHFLIQREQRLTAFGTLGFAPQLHRGQLRIGFGNRQAGSRTAAQRHRHRHHQTLIIERFQATHSDTYNDVGRGAGYSDPHPPRPGVGPSQLVAWR